MNLQPLYELRERLESSMIAGVSLLSDDFRLARAVEQTASLAGASPVFKRIYDTAKSALAPDCADRCSAVLDAYSLVDAVLCTQGVVETEGEIEEIQIPEGGGRFLSNAPYSAVAPLLEALTTSGSGHYSTVLDMHQSQPELFQDYRLKDALVKGLGASYSELADQVERWLCEEGEDVVPLLKRNLDPKGKKEMVRRIHIIESILKEKDNDYYISLLETAEKDVREAVILALRHDQRNTQLLLDLIKAEKGNCKKAAQSALGYMDNEEALEYWKTTMKKKPGNTAPFLAFSESDEISEMVAAALEETTDRLLNSVREGKPADAADVNTMSSLLQALNGKSSPAVCTWYRRAAQRNTANTLDKLVDAKNKPIHFSVYSGSPYYSGYYNGQDVPFTTLLPRVLTNAIIFSPSRQLFDLADELFESVGVEYFKPAVTAALLSRPAGEVYDRFIPYIKDVKKQYFDSCVKSFLEILGYIFFDKDNSGKYELMENIVDPLHGIRDRPVLYRQPLFEPLDYRWFDFFATGKLNRRNSNEDYLFGKLIDSKDIYICDVMGKYYYQKALDPACDSRNVFDYLKKCGWTGEKCKGVIVAGAKKGFNSSYWYFRNLVMAAPLTDSQKADEIEEVQKLVEKHKINIRNWNEQAIKELCAELRASGNSIG